LRLSLTGQDGKCQKHGPTFPMSLGKNPAPRCISGRTAPRFTSNAPEEAQSIRQANDASVDFFFDSIGPEQKER
jgi:hypothetical protein